jgi:hypothetical protein
LSTSRWIVFSCEPSGNIGYLSHVRQLLIPLLAVFAGRDASGALAKTSTKPEDVTSEWKHLSDKEKSTLNDWVTFFSKRYNVVGKVKGATNFDE